jgi:hypothetical protein
MGMGWGGGLILGGGGRLLETLSANVCRDRWEGRESAGEREREPEDPGEFLFGENCGYGHCCLVLGVVVEKLVCCLNCQAGFGKHLD